MGSKMASPIKQRQMQVKVYAPFDTYFDGPADSVSASNATGPFDILPRHKNFMCLLKPGELRVRRTGVADFTMKIKQAVMHVKSDRVTVFLDV
jgi:F0F1-type ATP synthase epsilon subunit